MQHEQACKHATLIQVQTVTGIDVFCRFQHSSALPRPRRFSFLWKKLARCPRRPIVWKPHAWRNSPRSRRWDSIRCVRSSVARRVFSVARRSASRPAQTSRPRGLPVLRRVRRARAQKQAVPGAWSRGGRIWFNYRAYARNELMKSRGDRPLR